MEGEYRFEVADSVLSLGPGWLLFVMDVDRSGFGLDMGHLAANPEERHRSYLFPGQPLRIGLGRDEEDPDQVGIEVTVPDVPGDLEGPYRLVVRVTGYELDAGVPVVGEEHIEFEWEHNPDG